MAHEIDQSNGRDNIAFLGSRNDVWHRLGTEMAPGQDVAAWAKSAGLDWTAIKSQGHYYFGDQLRSAGDRSFMVRSDNGERLGDNVVSDVYVPVQPAEVLAWFDQYISVDDRFALDVAGSLKGGSIIWATAKFHDPLVVAGDQHVARVLMSTTFDGSGATRNQMTTTRVVCNNTLRAAHGDKHRAVISTRHNTRFDAKAVARELADLAQSLKTFKAIGDAMAGVYMSAAEVSNFFKLCLEISPEAKADDISTRKMNQFRALSQAFTTTRRERGEKGHAIDGSPIDVWTALQAITRYVDHDRVSINGDQGEKQFLSATFGSGDALKGKAMELLMPRIADKIAA